MTGLAELKKIIVTIQFIKSCWRQKTLNSENDQSHLRRVSMLISHWLVHLLGEISSDGRLFLQISGWWKCILLNLKPSRLEACLGASTDYMCLSVRLGREYRKEFRFWMRFCVTGVAGHVRIIGWWGQGQRQCIRWRYNSCLLYTSDAADE